MSDVNRLAAALLGEGRVTVYEATYQGQVAAPVLASAVVYGNTGRHAVDLKYGGWSCTCVGWRHQHDGPGECPHIRAVQLVTGYHRPGPAGHEGVTRR